MTPLQIVALGLRLVALIWLLYTFNHLHGLFAYVNDDSGIVIRKSVIWLFAFLQIATCAVLWFYPRTIAEKLLPSASTAEQARSPVAMVEWQTLGVICIGIWALSKAIPDAIYWMTYYSMSFGADGDAFYLDAAQKARVASTVAELGIGLWLVFGARGFAAFLFKLRTAGVSK